MPTLTATERAQALVRLERQFMTPDIYQTDVWQIETSCGTELVPCDVADPDITTDIVRALRNYVEGQIMVDDAGRPVAERLSGKWLARLSATGYLDCTDWSCHDSEEEAIDYLIDQYDDGDDNDLDAEDSDAE